MSNWTFTENFLWGNDHPQCSAKNQSPINISTEQAKECNTLCDFKTFYNPSKCYINYKNNLIRVKYSPGSYIEYNNVLYELKELTIHLPTLHSIDNEKFDLEMCLIHSLGSESDSDDTTGNVRGVMLCRMFEIGPHFGEPENFLNQFINEVPRDPIDYDKEVVVSDKWSADMVMPKNKSFFLYDGGLPFPPCYSNYKVIVLEDIGKIGRTNIELLKLNIDKNIRPIQRLDNRPIFYRVYSSDYKKEKKEIKRFTSNNKYLKCEKKRIIEQKPKAVTTVVAEDVKKAALGFSDNFNNTMTQILLTVIILLILATSLVMTKYLFYHEYAQFLLKVLVGPVKMMSFADDWQKCTKKLDKPFVGDKSEVKSE